MPFRTKWDLQVLGCEVVMEPGIDEWVGPAGEAPRRAWASAGLVGSMVGWLAGAGWHSLVVDALDGRGQGRVSGQWRGRGA